MILAKKFKRLVRRRNTLVSEGVDSLLPCHHAVSIIPMARQYIKISQRIDDRRAAGEIHRIPIFAIRQGSREYLHWLAIELVQ